MDKEKAAAVAQIVSAIVAKSFDKDTDGCDLAFEEEGQVVLVDTNGRRMPLRSLISYVERCFE